MTRSTIALAAGLTLAATSAAVADPICADRPGKASATCTAPAGHVQLETALADWSLQRGGGTRATELLLGATAIKYGLSGRTHIEVDVAPFVRDRSSGGGAHAGASGIGDTLVRVKHRLTADGAPVQLALYPYVKVPTARRRLGNGRVEAGLGVPIGYALPGTKLSLALTPQADWIADGDGHGRHFGTTQVASFGWAASSKVTVAAELWGQWDWDPAGTVRQASADGSVAFLAREDLQLDAGVNLGLNRQTSDVELYAGIAKRF